MRGHNAYRPNSSVKNIAFKSPAQTPFFMQFRIARLPKSDVEILCAFLNIAGIRPARLLKSLVSTLT